MWQAFYWNDSTGKKIAYVAGEFRTQDEAVAAARACCEAGDRCSCRYIDRSPCKFTRSF